MSRIGRLPIAVPSGVDVTIEGRRVTVNGPKGTLSRELHPDMTVSREDDKIVVTRPTEQKTHKQLHGLTRTLVNNMVVGVTDGYRKGLEITGVGYRAVKVGEKLQLSLGYSHQIEIEPPPGHQRSSSRTRPASRSSASTRSWSARSPPRSARPASPSPTRARASATPASRSAARPARPARSAARSNRQHRRNEHDDAGRQPRRRTTQAPRPDPPPPGGDRVAAAPRGLPEQQPHLRAGHRRRLRADAGDRLDGREGASRLQATKTEEAASVGQLVAERAKSAGVERVVFDRAGFRYHGRIKSLADAAREAGLEF